MSFEMSSTVPGAIELCMLTAQSTAVTIKKVLVPYFCILVELVKVVTVDTPVCVT